MEYLNHGFDAEEYDESFKHIGEWDFKGEWRDLKAKIVSGQYQYPQIYDEMREFLYHYCDDKNTAQGVLDISERIIHQGPKEYKQQEYLIELGGWVEWVVYRLWGQDIGDSEELIDSVLGPGRIADDENDDYYDLRDFVFDYEADRGKEDWKVEQDKGVD